MSHWDLLFGYAMVSKIMGEDNVDLHEDYIPEDAMLKASTEFMNGSRVLKEMHTGGRIGKVLFAFPVTTDIAEAMGWSVEKTGLAIGVKPASEEIMNKFRDGTYSMFSIGASQVVEEEYNAEEG